MPDTVRRIDQRLKRIEDFLGIASLGSPITYSPTTPVNSILITTDNVAPTIAGTWTLLHSGNLLGGQVGTVYIWKRTA
jgi:hypothetical protein